MRARSRDCHPPQGAAPQESARQGLCGKRSRVGGPKSDKLESKQAQANTPPCGGEVAGDLCRGVTCRLECGRGGWMPWYSGADGGTVRTGKGCRRTGHCGRKWNNVGEPATTVCLGRFGGTWQWGLGYMLPAGGKLCCTDPEEDTDVPEPWKMRLGFRLLKHQQ